MASLTRLMPRLGWLYHLEAGWHHCLHTASLRTYPGLLHTRVVSMCWTFLCGSLKLQEKSVPDDKKGNLPMSCGLGPYLTLCNFYLGLPVRHSVHIQGDEGI